MTEELIKKAEAYTNEEIDSLIENDERGIKYKDSFDIIYYEYGNAFYGSYKGMRYRIARNPLENVFFKPKDQKGDGTLDATVWPEPKAYDKTADELKKVESFPFSRNGKYALIEWLNEQYESRKNEWEDALNNFNA